MITKEVPGYPPPPFEYPLLRTYMAACEPYIRWFNFQVAEIKKSGVREYATIY